MNGFEWSPPWVAGGIALLLGLAGGGTTIIGPWYKNLRKPEWKPPDWLFGPAWTIILACAATAAVVAWNAAPDAAARRDVLILFGVNGAFFLAWSPLFFMARRPDWALIEVVGLWVSVAVLAVGLARITPLAGLLVLPYLIWVTFAGVLNRAIVRLNAPFGG